MSSLWVINKAGGLIYQQDRFQPLRSSPSDAPLSSNEYLILAGTLHGIHAITARLNPTSPPPASATTAPSSAAAAARNRSLDGIQTLEAEGFRMSVMLTPTGTKLVLLTSPAHPTPQQVLQRAYHAYADIVMKNPFYTPEMPIRIEAFDKAIEALIR